MKPRELIQQWVQLFNQADAPALANLYHVDAINHQLPNEAIEGRDNIEQMFKQEFGQADMHCIVEHILEDGEWAILEWKDPMGLRGCGFFQVIDGKIKLQRGYWDKLSFLRMHNLPVPSE